MLCEALELGRGRRGGAVRWEGGERAVTWQTEVEQRAVPQSSAVPSAGLHPLLWPWRRRRKKVAVGRWKRGARRKSRRRVEEGGEEEGEGEADGEEAESGREGRRLKCNEGLNALLLTETTGTQGATWSLPAL